MFNVVQGRFKTTLYRLFSCKTTCVQSGLILHKQLSFAMFSQTYFHNITQKNLLQCCLNTPGTTLHRLKPCAMLTLWLQTTMHRKKLWIVFNVVLILLEWHCSGKNLLQCCLFNTPGTTLHRLKPYAVLSLRLQTIFHKKNPVQYCLNILETILYRKNPMLCCSRGSKQHSTVKNPVWCLNNIWSLFGSFYFGLVDFLIITGCCKCCANIVQI